MVFRLHAAALRSPGGLSSASRAHRDGVARAGIRPRREPNLSPRRLVRNRTRFTPTRCPREASRGATRRTVTASLRYWRRRPLVAHIFGQVGHLGLSGQCGVARQRPGWIFPGMSSDVQWCGRKLAACGEHWTSEPSLGKSNLGPCPMASPVAARPFGTDNRRHIILHPHHSSARIEPEARP